LATTLGQAFGSGSILVKADEAHWRAALRLGGYLLVNSGCTLPGYTEQMIQAVEELGPYTVIAPGLALAHARPSDLVLKTGLSLVTLRQPVEFGNPQNDPVSLVFALSAVDHDSHIDVLQLFAGLVSDQKNVNSLLTGDSIEAIRLALG
jgi:PTS system ascorbate-specific IIA component